MLHYSMPSPWDRVRPLMRPVPAFIGFLVAIIAAGNGQAAAPPLQITEIHYNPLAPTPAEEQAGFGCGEDFEFIELRNTGTEPVILTGIRFSRGIAFDFSSSAVGALGPGEFLVLANNAAGFAFRYPAPIILAGEYSGNLANSGEGLTLVDSLDQVIADFDFGDSGRWPRRADGFGSSLELKSPSEDPADP